MEELDSAMSKLREWESKLTKHDDTFIPMTARLKETKTAISMSKNGVSRAMRRLWSCSVAARVCETLEEVKHVANKEHKKIDFELNSEQSSLQTHVNPESLCSCCESC
jgi:hypothetical protein